MNNIKTIVCRKFGANPSLYWNKKNSEISLFIGKRKLNKFEEYDLVSTNGKFIIVNGVETDITPQSLNTLKTRKSIVLTAKEYYILVKLEVSLSEKLFVFEKEFPIFPDIKYIPCPDVSFRSLSNKMLKVRKLGFMNKNIIGDILYTHKKHTFKKVTKKNSLDSSFYDVIGDGYQEVFKFKEESESRVVIALDFNSMFPSCMAGEFINPRNLFYTDFRGQDVNIDNLSRGVYRVILSNPNNELFNKFHPFKFRAGNQSFNFKLTQTDKLDLILHQFELEYYKNFFDSYEVIEGIISDSAINHPLYKRAKRVYNQRLGFKKNLDISNELLAKFKLVSMHSVTNPVKIKSHKFSKSYELIKFVEKHFSFSFEENISNNENIKIINSFKQFNAQYIAGYWVLKCPNNNNNESIYCLSSAVIAHSRLKVLKTIMDIAKLESVDICYCNIDSIHLSVEKDKLDTLMSGISSSVSSKMGDLKVQTVAEKGYWFDVGRYWLIDKSSVIQHRNILFNRKGGSVFNQIRIIPKIVKNDFFDYIKNFKLFLFNSFSYTKRLKIESGFYERYTFNEIENFKVANETLIEEMTQSKINKITTFRKIKSLYERSSN